MDSKRADSDSNDKGKGFGGARAPVEDNGRGRVGVKKEGGQHQDRAQLLERLKAGRDYFPKRGGFGRRKSRGEGRKSKWRHRG